MIAWTADRSRGFSPAVGGPRTHHQPPGIPDRLLIVAVQRLVAEGLGGDVGRHLEFSWAQITRSKEFHGQRQKDVFGSINLKWKFSF